MSALNILGGLGAGISQGLMNTQQIQSQRQNAEYQKQITSAMRANQERAAQAHEQQVTEAQRLEKLASRRNQLAQEYPDADPYELEKMFVQEGVKNNYFRGEELQKAYETREKLYKTFGSKAYDDALNGNISTLQRVMGERGIAIDYTPDGKGVRLFGPQGQQDIPIAGLLQMEVMSEAQKRILDSQKAQAGIDKDTAYADAYRGASTGYGSTGAPAGLRGGSPAGGSSSKNPSVTGVVDNAKVMKALGEYTARVPGLVDAETGDVPQALQNSLLDSVTRMTVDYNGVQIPASQLASVDPEAFQRLMNDRIVPQTVLQQILEEHVGKGKLPPAEVVGFDQPDETVDRGMWQAIKDGVGVGENRGVTFKTGNRKIYVPYEKIPKQMRGIVESHLTKFSESAEQKRVAKTERAAKIADEKKANSQAAEKELGLKQGGPNAAATWWEKSASPAIAAAGKAALEAATITNKNLATRAANGNKGAVSELLRWADGDQRKIDLVKQMINEARGAETSQNPQRLDPTARLMIERARKGDAIAIKYLKWSYPAVAAQIEQERTSSQRTSGGRINLRQAVQN